jgi:hypothetical protein
MYIVDNSILKELSPHIFWNCDVNKFNFKKNKKNIIERIAEYGLEKDEILMWQMYSYYDIKKIIINMEYLPYFRIIYYSSLLKIKEKKFRCYRNKSYLWNY